MRGNEYRFNDDDICDTDQQKFFSGPTGDDCLAWLGVEGRFVTVGLDISLILNEKK